MEFATKPALAQKILERAFEAGVPAGWVAADALYGSNRGFRMFLERRGEPFVLVVKSDEPLWALDERGPAQVRAERLAEDLSERYFRGLAGAGAISLGPNAAITEDA